MTIGVSAPVDTNSSRTDIVAPENSEFNEWISEQSAALALAFLKLDWLDRWGPRALLLLDRGDDRDNAFAARVAGLLKTESCWPTLARRRGGKTAISALKDIVVPEDPIFLGLLSDKRYLDLTSGADTRLKQLAINIGGLRFGINSMIRLRCAGADDSDLGTNLGTDDSRFHYTDYESAISSPSRQTRFSNSIDAVGRLLRPHHKNDLGNTASTLAADGTLKPAHNLFVFRPGDADAPEIPGADRLHRVLVGSRVMARLCQPFKTQDWLRSTAIKLTAGTGTEEQREAIWRYLSNGQPILSRRAIAALREAPVLKDSRGDWCAPKDIMILRTSNSKALREVLHFPHRSYRRNTTLATQLRFRTKIHWTDIRNFAEEIGDDSKKCDRLLALLARDRKLLSGPLVTALAKIDFLPSSHGGIAKPSDLFINSEKNRICMGDVAPYAIDGSPALLEKLGCKKSSGHREIIARLEKSAEQNIEPMSPRICYSSLVASLKTERVSTDIYKDREILWTGDDFSAPADLLIGRGHERQFLGSVPILRSGAGVSDSDAVALGASKEPDQRHWRTFFEWLDVHVPTDVVVDREIASACRSAYARLDGLPSGVSFSTRCLMDQKGLLNSKSDILGKRLAIDDFPALSTSCEDHNVQMRFIARPDHRTRGFWEGIGIPRLTQLALRLGVESGDEVAPQKWLAGRTPKLVKRLHTKTLVNALTTLIEAKIAVDSESVRPDIATLEDALAHLNEIVEVDKLEARYRVQTAIIPIPAEVRFDNDRILLRSPIRNSELLPRVSRGIADLVTSDIDVQRMIEDPIFRLLSCTSNREMQAYFGDQGIRWDPRFTFKDESADDPEDWNDDPDTEGTGRSRWSEDQFLDPKTGEDGPEPEEDLDPAPSNDVDDNDGGPDDPTEPTREMPPVEDVELEFVETAPDWKAKKRGGGGGGGGPHPDGPAGQDPDWLETIGQRGERLIYDLEVKRITKLGFSAEKVVWNSQRDKYADVDIISVDENGNRIWIEVKSTEGDSGWFKWSGPEIRQAINHGDQYQLYRVYRATSLKPPYKCFENPFKLLIDEKFQGDIATVNMLVEPLET